MDGNEGRSLWPLERQRDFDRLCERLSLADSAPIELGENRRYHVLDDIGRGAMGSVYRVRDQKLRRIVALKVVKPGGRGLSEAKALAKVEHHNIVRVYDVFELPTKEHAIALEYLDGPTMRAWQHDQTRPVRIKAYIDAARGLEHAHTAGIVHRDFKPDNVVVVQHDQRPRVVVVDFGLAGGSPESAHADVPPIESSGHGTYAYMAPEQRTKPATSSADQYAFCVALWEAIVGTRPFTHGWSTGDELPVVAPSGMPTWLYSVVKRGLAREPEQRYPDMRALRRALERGLLWHRVSRSLALVAVIGGALVALVVYMRPDPCLRWASSVDALWDEARAERARRSYANTEIGWQSDAASYAIGALDQISESWTTQALAVCEAKEADATAPGLDRRARCLDDWREATTELVAQLEAGDPGAVTNVIAYTGQLSGELDDCNAPRAVIDAEVASLLREAERAELDRHFETALELANAAKERAVEAPTCLPDTDQSSELGAAEFRIGHVAMAMERWDLAAAAMRRSAVAAVTCGDEIAEYEAWLFQAIIGTLAGGAPNEIAHAWALADTTLRLADGERSDSLRRIELLRSRGYVELSAGRHARATASFDAAAFMLEELDETNLLLWMKINNGKALAYFDARDFQAAAQTYRESVERLSSSVGEDHPLTRERRAFQEIHLGLALFNNEEYDAALPMLERVRDDPGDMDSLLQLRAWSGLIQTNFLSDREEDALASSEHALTWLSKHREELPPEPRAELLAAAATVVANAEPTEGSGSPPPIERAIELQREALALAEGAGRESSTMLINLTYMLLSAGRNTEARESLTRLEVRKRAGRLEPPEYAPVLEELRRLVPRCAD